MTPSISLFVFSVLSAAVAGMRCGRVIALRKTTSVHELILLLLLLHKRGGPAPEFCVVSLGWKGGGTNHMLENALV
jgi:hypothetical protein